MARRVNTNKIRDEYNKMVDEINTQLKALRKADPNSVTLERYNRYFRKVSTDQPNYNKIRSMKKKASDLLKSGQLSLNAQERSKAAAIESLHRDGYTFINKKNFNSYMRFLDDARSRGLGAMYSSEQILEAINYAEKKGLSKKDIEKNIERWEREIAKQDEDGKTIEIIKPLKLYLKWKRAGIK